MWCKLLCAGCSVHSAFQVGIWCLHFAVCVDLTLLSDCHLLFALVSRVTFTCIAGVSMPVLWGCMEGQVMHLRHSLHFVVTEGLLCMQGLRNLLRHLGARPGGPAHFVISDLREELVVYINGWPYLRRELEMPAAALHHAGMCSDSPVCVYVCVCRGTDQALEHSWHCICGGVAASLSLALQAAGHLLACQVSGRLSPSA